MPQVAFDTLKYADRLKEGGVQPELAETFARAHAEVFTSMMTDMLATKDDIRDVRQEIKDVRQEMLTEFQLVRHEMMQLDHKFENRFLDLEKQISGIVPKLTAILGGIVVTGIGGLVTLMTLLHLHL